MRVATADHFLWRGINTEPEGDKGRHTGIGAESRSTLARSAPREKEFCMKTAPSG